MADVSNDTELNEIEKMAMIVSILTGLELTEINTMPLIKTRELMAKMTFINEQPSNKFVNDFTIDGVKYFVNPDITQITKEQFEAFDFFTKDKTAITKNLHNLMSIVCLKEGEKYIMANAPAKAQLFYDKMTFDIVAPVSHFFFQLLSESYKHIRHSLELQIDKAIVKNQKLIEELSQEV